MQVTSAAPQPRPSSLARNLGWFLVAPVTAAVLLILAMVVVLSIYQQRHADQIFTGVTVWGIDLSGLSRAEAQQRLSSAFTYPEDPGIVLRAPAGGEEWVLSPAQLGLTFDMEATAEAAYRVGRHGNPITRLAELFNGWYFGWNMAPVVVLDEGALDQALAEIAQQINRPASDASLTFDGTNVGYAAAQVGRSLDVEDAKARLMATLNILRQGEIQLLVHETQPRVHDTSQAAEQIEQIISGPMTLYLQEPLVGDDLNQVVVPPEEIVKWIRVQTVDDAQGQATTEVIIDENAVRARLAPYQETLKRDPINARFYFDDDTRELVLVEPHVSGRALDLDATVKQFVEQLKTPARSMPFVLQEVVPVVHSGATAAELGITELVSESTTWFYGSSDERKHNIARAASNFYGITIAPGQEFSFNQYLGDVSEEEGYETGLIIFGGRTIEGVGGGVCQVSTTAFQAAFWAGYPIEERWEHGYRVGYYDDGEGPGMDATVFSPLVDFRFINDTPYYLLIENYYNEANSSLTFKFYSTSMGRTIIKEGPEIANVKPAKPDIWELNEELEPGEIEQVDWAVEGADVTVVRRVLNTSGELIREDTFVSHYIPWQNIYQYGPGTEIPSPEATPEPSPEVVG